MLKFLINAMSQEIKTIQIGKEEIIFSLDDLVIYI